MARPLSMLRNQDRPELLLFVGANSGRWTDGTARPGATRLAKEALDAGTPSIWLVEDSGGAEALEALATTPWPPGAPPVPSPTALQAARESVEIAPDAYGGSDGFGRGRAMPERAPLAARCVVIAASRAACVAGRAAGMRVVGLCSESEESLDDAADVVFGDLDDDWDAVTFDDLYTPGSYWINPPTPRTVDGLHADPNTGEVVEYDAFRSTDVAPLDWDAETERDLTDAERAILDDLAM